MGGCTVLCYIHCVSNCWFSLAIFFLRKYKKSIRIFFSALCTHLFPFLFLPGSQMDRYFTIFLGTCFDNLFAACRTNQVLPNYRKKGVVLFFLPHVSHSSNLWASRHPAAPCHALPRPPTPHTTPPTPSSLLHYAPSLPRRHALTSLRRKCYFPAFLSLLAL